MAIRRRRRYDDERQLPLADWTPRRCTSPIHHGNPEIPADQFAFRARRLRSVCRLCSRVRRRILTDAQLKVFDDDVWENYPSEGAETVAGRWNVEPVYVMKRAARIGADRFGTHLLTFSDKILIVGLIRAGLTDQEIAKKFDVRSFAIRQLRERVPEIAGAKNKEKGDE